MCCLIIANAHLVGRWFEVARDWRRFPLIRSQCLKAWDTARPRNNGHNSTIIIIMLATSNDRMIDDWLSGKCRRKRSWPNCNVGLLFWLSLEGLRKSTKHLSGLQVSVPRVEVRNSRIRSRNASHSAMTFGNSIKFILVIQSNSVHFSSILYLFTCRLNSPKDNNKVSTS
jgi:hypothetical protein